MHSFLNSFCVHKVYNNINTYISYADYFLFSKYQIDYINYITAVEVQTVYIGTEWPLALVWLNCEIHNFMLRWHEYSCRVHSKRLLRALL